MTTQANPDYYQLLGVNRASSKEEIESAFRTLENEFHASGKPKNIDDVEWLRHLVKAHEVLSDEHRRREYDVLGIDPGSDVGTALGYDFGRIKEMKDTVDAEQRKWRIRRWTWTILDLFRGNF